MKEMLIFSKFQVKLLFKDYQSALLGFLIPIISFLIFSNLFKAQGLEVGPGISIVDYLIPSFSVMIITNAVLLMFGQYYAAYADSGALLKYKLLGLADWNVTVSIFKASLLFEVLAICILVVIGNITQNISIPIENLLSIIPAFLLINFFQYSLVILLQSISPTAAAYNAFSMIVLNYQMFLGGLTFPPEILPETLFMATKYLNPIYHGLVLYRGVWTENKSILAFGPEIGILLLTSIICLVINNFVNKRKEF